MLSNRPTGMQEEFTGRKKMYKRETCLRDLQSKSGVLTEEGLVRLERLFAELFGKR